MAEHLHIIKPPEARQAPGLVMTQTATDILRSVKLVADEPGTLTMVAGIPGCGKSETLLRFIQNNPEAIKLDIVAGEGRIWDLAAALMQHLEMGVPNSRRMREDRQRITEAIGFGRVLILDEAQYLANYNPRGGFNFDAYEWLRAMAEEGSFSVVFCGDLSLADAIGSVPQLRRRMVRPVEIRSIPKPDVAMFAASRGVTDSAVVDALAAMAKRHGGIGDVKRTLQHAEIRAEGRRIAAADVKAALLYLGLSARGDG
ncbi:AAA family ATPase [Thalassococcus sp. CAU 1522]|uniref:AAA family ATPase n=1 Tax=Thalassococcus arenae TaxID=2851652 RepID=A0ABS6NAF2_9RHOB|nr:AAA family ATPase [Thalassococcus arenae]MBV2360987.1 AAA family ATPase [Thalassococcus arenae]